MKPTFLYALLARYNWLPVVLGVAFFVFGTLTVTRGAGEASSLRDGSLLAGIGALLLVVLVADAHRRSR